jgi:glycosyltransferase involved in cell wall biosynthesis
VSSDPVVSIVIPCYNQGHFLPANLESLARATSRRHQAIVINDGSQARSTQVALQRLKPAGSHQELVVIDQGNTGLPGARNSGLDVATGKHIQFLDADDMLLPRALDRQVDRAEGLEAKLVPFERRAVVVGGYFTLHEETGVCERPDDQDTWRKSITFDNVALMWERGLSIPIHCALFSAEFLQPGVRFETRVRSKEDWLFWLQMLALGIRPTVTDVDVAVYRTHGASMTKHATISNARGWVEATRIAHERWPTRFDDDAVLKAQEHFKTFYGLTLWRLLGPSLPWTFFSAMDPGAAKGLHRERTARRPGRVQQDDRQAVEG